MPLPEFPWSRPLLLSPMAGGPGSPELVAAVSEAGGLGMLGAGYLSPAQIGEACSEVRARTSRPFGVNLFVPELSWWQRPGGSDITRAAQALSPLHAARGLPPPQLPPHSAPDAEAQFQAVLAARPAVFSFTFGIPHAAWLQALRDARIFTIGTATSLAEARRLQAVGVNAISVQGSEAGGHRGSFLSTEEEALTGTLALVRLLAHELKVPLVAAGGVMDASGLRAALTLGAVAAQCGTAFLLAREAGTHPAYRTALRGAVGAEHDPTTLTRAVSGRLARGLTNSLTRLNPHTLPYPHQNALTRALRDRAAELGDSGLMSLWAGQGAPLIRETNAAEIVRSLTD